jgi:SAM-dependent methyltransferase
MMPGAIEYCSTRKLIGWASDRLGGPERLTVLVNGHPRCETQSRPEVVETGQRQRNVFEVAVRVGPADVVAVRTAGGQDLDGSPAQPQIDRLDLLLLGLDLGRLTGLEIGPSSKPAVSKAEGDIYYLDVVDAGGLAEKYKDEAYAEDPFPEIDFLIGEGSLLDSCGGRQFDYVVASHVIEHVPDTIGWLREIGDLLSPGGSLRLAIPDKRFTFDVHRPLTTFSELLDCYYSRLRRPSYRHVHEMKVSFVKVEADVLWRGGYPPPMDKVFSAEELSLLAERIRNGEYIDVHCHTFTPDSFLSHFTQMSELGLCELELSAIYPTPRGEAEFHAHLYKPRQPGRRKE